MRGGVYKLRKSQRKGDIQLNKLRKIFCVYGVIKYMCQLK
jgi:hypothetical protein